MPRNTEPLFPERKPNPNTTSATSTVNKNAEMLVAMYEDDVQKTLARMCQKQMLKEIPNDKGI